MEDLRTTKFYLFMWMSALPAHVSVQRVPFGVMDIRRVCRIPSKGNHRWLYADMQVGSTRVLEEQLVLSATRWSLYPLLYLLTMVMGMWIFCCTMISNEYSIPLSYLIFYIETGPCCAVLVASASRGLLIFHSLSILSPWMKPLLTFSLLFTTCVFILGYLVFSFAWMESCVGKLV